MGKERQERKDVPMSFCISIHLEIVLTSPVR